VQNGVPVPASAMLEQNYPNPFNPQTTISFTVPEDGFATISIYDISGAWVRTLAAGEMKKGKTTVSWDGRIESDEDAPSGTYFYRLQTKSSTETKKMLLIR